jgi:hypothetical protein
MEHKILVVYVGVAMIRSEDIDNYVHKVASKIIPTTFEGEIIVIPVQDINTRIECINPKYITEPELIQRHSELMKELQEALLEQIKIIKEDKHE